VAGNPEKDDVKMFSGTMPAFGPAVQVPPSASAPQRAAVAERAQQPAAEELPASSLHAADSCLHPAGVSINCPSYNTMTCVSNRYYSLCLMNNTILNEAGGNLIHEMQWRN